MQHVDRRESCVRAAGFVLALMLAGGVPIAASERPEIAPLPRPVPEPPGSPFLLEETSVHAVVTGPVAHVEVTQRWRNPNPFPVDGLYIFPLPEDAAVNDMRLVLGERTIQATVHRREEARRLYDQARREGRVAGLLDQERPNVFAQQVANILPGVSIDVVLAFDHPVRCESGDCEYVFPTVVGPRFIPASQAAPGRIDPPVVGKGRVTGHKLKLSVDLDAGVAARDIGSPSHRVLVTRKDDARAAVVLGEGDGARLDRDFRLRWTVGGEAPEIGVLAWRDAAEGGDEPGVFTLILQPPAAPADADATRRELVFVLDCSGSMRGVPLDAARSVVRRALEGLRPGDTFRLVRFSDRASGLGDEPLASTPENVRRALGYLDSLQGQGGTQMLSGIRAALDPPADPERLRIVAFLTDGFIGNESQVFAEVRARIGDARLFSFGIGSSVNRHLLEGLAEEGRGVAAFLGPRETPDEMVERFLARMDTPVLTDLRISFEDLDVMDLEPARIPDLFAGQALLIHGRYRVPGTGLVTVEGKRRGRSQVLSRVVHLLDREEGHEALGRLWARARIHRLERQLHDGPREDVKESIVALGLRHRLMTRWTSLVAVDSEVSNLDGRARPMNVPVEMPEDVSYEGVFGSAANAPARALMLGSSTVSGESALAARALPSGELARMQRAAQPRPTPATAKQEMRDASLPHGPSADASRRFLRLSLVQADGSRVVFEADGEIWAVDGRRRTLLGALDAAALETLGELLARAVPGAWPAAAPPGRRIVAEGPWGSAVLALPARDPAVRSLVQALENAI